MNSIAKTINPSTVHHYVNDVSNEIDQFCAKAREILFPGENVIGIADFLHINPSMPNRELSGLLRTKTINKSICRLSNFKIVSLVYDCVLPISEARGEGGGFGFKFGISKKTFPILEHRNRPFHLQKPSIISIDKILHMLTIKLCKRYNLCHTLGQSLIKEKINILTPFFTVQDENASSHFSCSKKLIYQTILDEKLDKWYLLSEKYVNMAYVLELAIKRGMDVFSIPISNARQYLFQYTNSEGLITGFISYVNGKTILIENNIHKSISKTQILELLIAKRLLPSFEIYFLSFILIPGWFHFGNLYDRFNLLGQWYANNNNKKPLFHKIGRDGENSISYGGTFIRGNHRSALLSHDIFTYKISDIRQNAIITAKTGKSLIPDTKNFFSLLEGHLLEYNLF